MNKMRLIGLIIYLMFVTTGCSTKNTDKQPTYDWSTLTILSNNYLEINIESEPGQDSATVTTHETSSIFEKNPKEGQSETHMVAFSKAEKDSICLLVQQLTTAPAKPKSFCTDFVGSLYLSLNYGEQYKQSYRYSSVCNWSEMSDTTARLYKILKRKIKEI